MDLRIAVDLRGGCEEEARSLLLGEAEALQGPESTDLEGLDGMLQVVAGRCGRREMEHPVDRTRDGKPLGDVRLVEREPRAAKSRGEVLGPSRQEGVDADDLPALSQEPIAEM